MKHPIRRRVLFNLFQAAQVVIPLLPLRLTQAAGAWLGEAAYWFLRGQRRIASEQLKLAFGAQHSRRQRRRIVRALFRHLGMNAVEWLALPRLTPGRLRALVEVEGLEHLTQALAAGRGAIIISAHFGNWEFLACALTARGIRGGVVARRLRYPEYEAAVTGWRRAKGVETFDRDASVRELIRHLRANEVIGMLPDQDVESLEGVSVNFFGRPARTPAGPVALAAATGAPLVPAYIIREGWRHRIVIEPPLALMQSGDRQADLQENTARWSRVTERHIREHPEQWVWMHQRWKSPPHGGASGS